MLNKHLRSQSNVEFLYVFLLSIPIIYAEVPAIACPNYFRYYSDGKGFFGKITLPSLSPGNTKVEVHLSQIGTVPQPNPASLSFYENQQETTNNILSGKPIAYRVDFPVSNVLPKLTLISVNNVVMCSDQEYPAPSTKIKLINNLEVTVKTLITPFVVRGNSSGAENTNIFHQDGKPTTVPPSKYMENPFLSGKWNKPSTVTPITEASNIFKANPDNMFLHPPTSVEKTTNLNEICGLESVVMTPLIRGGTSLSRGEFPWLTAIYRKKNRDLKFLCGGSLISKRTVISAAHCFVEPRLPKNKILVLLGRNNLESVDEEGSQHRQLSSLLLHPEYNSNAISDADIALLQLETPVTFSRYIKPICLWNAETDVNKIVGLSAYAAGWGADENGESVTEQPKKIETLIADDSACKRSLQDYQMMTSSRTICVKANKDSGPCTGDSGGGLAIKSDGRWTLRGIVSAGLTREGKCFSHEYFYFCDVGKHMSWILQNMWV